jgi:hypothetical protein
VRRTLLVVGVALVATLTACGKDASSDGTALTITVVADKGAEPETYELECDPAGGDHPQPGPACKALDAAGAEVFEQHAKGQACTQIFGGPQTATVTGTYEGDEIDAKFSRADGCQIDRWDQLGTTFFNVPLQ